MAEETASAADVAPPTVEFALSAACLAAGVAGWAAEGTSASPWLFALAYLTGGYTTAIDAFLKLCHCRFGIDFLMLAAASGAAALGKPEEGATLLFLFSFSGALEKFALHRTHQAVEALLKLRPATATRVLADGAEQSVLVADIASGDLLRLRPGERFAIDGTVAEGQGWADESTLTGESLPIEKSPGHEVFAGTILLRGTLLVRCTRPESESALEKIVRLVQQAQAARTPAESFVQRWEQPYVVAVLAAALILLLGSYALHERKWDDAAYHAMVFLVAASPCAVVAAAPAVLLSAIARAGRRGVLFKGGAQLEALADVDVFAFDKTGTLTRGRPAVSKVWTMKGATETDVLRQAAAVEAPSEHPLATAVTAAARQRGIDVAPAVHFDSHVGQGAHAVIDGVWAGVGREDLFASHKVVLPPAAVAAAEELRKQGNTALLVGTGAGLFGVIAVADEVRPEAAEALLRLRWAGVRRLVVLTGDHAGVAAAVAAAVGADEFKSGLLPEQKVLSLAAWGHAARGSGAVAMVGDGVNDAPALAAADVGIAMGGAGTDVALEVADVVLMGDDLRSLAFAVWLSRLARRRVTQNLGIALGAMGLLVVGSLLNLPLWLAVVGHEGSTLAVVLNGVRLLAERCPWDSPGGEALAEPANRPTMAESPATAK